MVHSVLLVEDDPLIAMSQTEALTDVGFLVHPAGDGASALDIAKAVGLSVAVIDMGLPDCSGDHVARELRARYPGLPIIICTGYSAATLANVAKEIDALIVEKPIDEGALIVTLCDHMGISLEATHTQ